MHKRNRTLSGSVGSIAMCLMLSVASSPAQSKPPGPAPATLATTSIATDEQVADTQDQLLKLLRLSPTLTEVIARDPSLLANQDYVSRTNPQLAQFLQTHPEVARNPDFPPARERQRSGNCCSTPTGRLPPAPICKPTPMPAADVATLSW